MYEYNSMLATTLVTAMLKAWSDFETMVYLKTPLMGKDNSRGVS